MERGWANFRFFHKGGDVVGQFLILADKCGGLDPSIFGCHCMWTAPHVKNCFFFFSYMSHLGTSSTHLGASKKSAPNPRKIKNARKDKTGFFNIY